VKVCFVQGLAGFGALVFWGGLVSIFFGFFWFYFGWFFCWCLVWGWHFLVFLSVCQRCPCAGRHLLFFAAAKKSRQKKAATNARMTQSTNSRLGGMVQEHSAPRAIPVSDKAPAHPGTLRAPMGITQTEGLQVSPANPTVARAASNGMYDGFVTQFEGAG
jgi:hypothetical protein